MLDGERYALNMWETSIGRSPSCDISISYDTVARIQAVFTRRIDGWYIYNIAPKAVIKINGTRIEKKATVTDGDILTMGSMRFRFEVVNDPVQKVGKKRKKKNKNKNKKSNASPDTQRKQPQKTVYDIDKVGGINTSASYNNFSGANTFTVQTPDRQANAPARKTSYQPKIINRDTSEAFILCGNEVTIGRGSRCDIRLRSSQTAKLHAVLILFEDGWAIEDRSGNKGTFLNGMPVTAPQLLFNGDIIALGDERLFYEGGSR